MRLGTMLLRDAVITLTQLEQALRAQVLSGGRLGTNLVELGFLDLNTLSRYLARALDTPLAIADRFEKADPKFIEAFGAEMADRYSALPLGMEPGSADTVQIAMLDPSDYQSIAEIEKHLGMRVAPFIAAELRLFYYLERYYGIRRRTRFTRSSGEETQAPSSRRERRATQPFRGLGMPPAVHIVPRKTRDMAELVTPRPAKKLSFGETCELIDHSEQRNQIGDALLQYTVGRFECAAIFLVRESNAIGWRAHAPGLGVDALERLNIPLGGASIFQAAHDSGKPYRGRALSPGHPFESELWSLFAIEHEPTDLHVVPVSLGNRVINLIYAHGYRDHETPEAYHQELVLLATRISDAYLRIITETTSRDE